MLNMMVSETSIACERRLTRNPPYIGRNTMRHDLKINPAGSPVEKIFSGNGSGSYLEWSKPLEARVCIRNRFCESKYTKHAL